MSVKESAPATNAKKKPKVDPEIMKLRAKHQAEVREYMKTRSSAGILKTIIDKRLPSMTKSDLEKLYDYLGTLATPPLPGVTEPHTRPAAPAPAEDKSDPWLKE